MLLLERLDNIAGMNSDRWIPDSKSVRSTYPILIIIISVCNYLSMHSSSDF